MVWKQDLAKLKQAFREAGGPPPPPPKPKPKPSETKDLNDEDAMFLAAMGTPVAKPSLRIAPESAAAPAASAASEVSFEANLADLKGLKPMAATPVFLASPEPAKVATPEPVEAPVPEALEPAVPVAEEPQAESPLPTKAPVRIQLAAGMAVEVDGSLDLRGHSVADAIGRLRDRVEDGAIMGWRTLHVTLGEDAALHQALLSFLAAGQAPRIGRYAQAPIPMGGVQAWVLYY